VHCQIPFGAGFAAPHFFVLRGRGSRNNLLITTQPAHYAILGVPNAAASNEGRTPAHRAPLAKCVNRPAKFLAQLILVIELIARALLRVRHSCASKRRLVRICALCADWCGSLVRARQEFVPST